MYNVPFDFLIYGLKTRQVGNDIVDPEINSG